MYIHLGNRKIISDRNYIGIFNTDTIKMSEINDWISVQLNKDDKSFAISLDNKITASSLSPYTLIKRKTINTDYVWRRDNDQKL